ncbi:MAG TPA: hypothetical protein VH442_11225, partial [Micromonosporaceae bacterium]
YKQQSQLVDNAQRKPIIDQMQQILYQDAPYIVLFYPDDLEAYNSAKWGGVVRQPAKTGVAFYQFGTYTSQNVDLRADLAANTSKSGSNTIIWVIVGIVAVILVAGLAFGLLRRRSTADERE